MIDAGEPEVGEREPTQLGHSIVGRQGAGAHVGDQLAKGRLVHLTILLPADLRRRIVPRRRVPVPTVRLR